MDWDLGTMQDFFCLVCLVSAKPSELLCVVSLKESNTRNNNNNNNNKSGSTYTRGPTS